VEEVLGHHAMRLDVEARSVEIDDASVLSADAIVLATGASPRTLPVPEESGVTERVFVLRTIDDALALRSVVTALEAPRLVVVGAGFIGAEVASTCARLGCRVTVIEAMDIPLVDVLGPVVGQHCGSLHVAHGVDLRVGASVTGIAKSANASQGLVVSLVDGDVVEADIVVVGIGVVPCVQWLTGSDLTIDNGVVCDERLFAAEGIVAAGDVARWRWCHDGAQEDIRIEHWQVAAEMGAAAARSVLAGHSAAVPFAPIPYFWSDQYGVRFQVLGNPGGTDEVRVVDGSFTEGKFVALYGREDRLRAVMAIGKPQQLMSYRPLLEAGSSWSDALDHAAAQT